MGRSIFIFLSCVFFNISFVYADCYKIYGYQASPTNHYITTAQGYTDGSWTGACDTCNGSLGLPNVLNFSNSPFQPYGTLLASSVVPFTVYGKPGGYNPEQVFFKCLKDDPVYEMYSTNGDNYYSGYCGALGTHLGDPLGLEYAYLTAWRNIILQITNLETGLKFKCEWQERLLTGLDEDGPWKFVKAKNLSAIRVDLYTAPNYNPSYGLLGYTTPAYNYTQPNGYIAIKGPGLAAPTTGNPHSSDYNGWHYNYPGAIGLNNNTLVRRSPTCAVTSNTPVVLFPSVTVSQINAGGFVEVPFTINFECSSGFVSGVALNATAIGIKVSPAAYSHSIALGIVNAYGGLEYLVSDNYGASGFAGGVGVKILRNNVPISLLSSDNSALGSANANAMGWYPVTGSATVNQGVSGGVERYSEVFKARLEKLSVGTQPPVTAGAIYSTAQIVIRVQ